MNETNDIPHEAKRLRLLAAALDLKHYTSTASNVVPIPGGDQVIVIGTPAEVADVLLSRAARDVLAERSRQVEAEGMTNEGDDRYRAAELPRAAASYILNDDNDEAPCIWPWAKSWWKPRDARANYVRAAALPLAEIERIDRAKQAVLQQLVDQTQGLGGYEPSGYELGRTPDSEGGHHD
jgi:hypothetical protein